MDEQLNQQGQETTGENSNLVDVNWDMISIDELKRGYMRQSDYTKKTQKLKELETQSTNISQDNNAEEWKQWIKENVLAPEIENIKKEIHSDQSFNDLLSYNPELNRHADAIKALSKSEGLSPEEIIEKYKFWSIDKLQRAKERKLIWDRTLETQPKSISDLSPQEYEDWKKQHTWNNKREKRGWF